MGRAYLVVEGHGEVDAIRNLATRLWADLGLPWVVWAPPIRGTDMKTQAGILKSCEIDADAPPGGWKARRGRAD